MRWPTFKLFGTAICERDEEFEGQTLQLRLGRFFIVELAFARLDRVVENADAR